MEEIPADPSRRGPPPRKDLRGGAAGGEEAHRGDPRQGQILGTVWSSSRDEACARLSIGVPRRLAAWHSVPQKFSFLLTNSG